MTGARGSSSPNGTGLIFVAFTKDGFQSRGRRTAGSTHYLEAYMNSYRLSLVCAVALVAASCSNPAALSDLEAPSFDLAAPGHRAVGSGHVDQASGMREFTFHAVQAPDGSASGSYKIVLPNGLFLEVDVTCLSVDGNTAWVGGVIRDTNAAIVVIGSTSMFYAIDNGEGSADPDIVSIALINGAAGLDLAFCANQPLELPALTVDRGNVEVQ